MEQKVLAWIEAHFETTELSISYFPLLPAGKRIRGKDGSEMVVYYEILSGKVKYVYPSPASTDTGRK